jgi:hypothetical protein
MVEKFLKLAVLAASYVFCAAQGVFSAADDPGAPQGGAQDVASVQNTTNMFRYSQGSEVPPASIRVFIPNNVEFIENLAFINRKTLKQVCFEAGSQVKTIKSCAFSGCESLQSICIPASVEAIWMRAFAFCKQLKTVTFENNSKLKNIEPGAFGVCSSLKQIVIPDSVEKIALGAFVGYRPIHIELSMKSLNVRNPGDEEEVRQSLTNICSMPPRIDLVPRTTVLIRDGGELSNWQVNKKNQFELIKKG